MAKEQNIQNILALVTVMTTFLLPLLYVFGYAYELGYLGGYGISSELFPKSIPEYLTSSLLFFIITFGFTANFIVYGLASIVLIFLLYALLHITAHKNSAILLKYTSAPFLFSKPLFVRIYDFILKLNLKILAPQAKFTFGVFLILYSLLGIMLAVSLITTIPLFIGKKVAADEIKKSKVCMVEKFTENCVSLSEYGNVIALGRLIASSDKYIALYNNGKTTIYASQNYDINVHIDSFNKASK